MKTCTRCGETKALSEFGTRNRRGKTEPMSRCRPCNRDYQREWRAAHPDKMSEYKSAYRERHPERVRESKRLNYARNSEAYLARNKAWRARNPDKIAEYTRNPDRREDRLRRIHGISLDQFHEMWNQQNGQCPICLRDLPYEYLNREELKAAPVKPHVDHSHADDVVRGILCSTCNQGIGMFREDPEVFARAVVYLSGQFPTITPQRSSGVANGEKVECKNGHPFTEENTYIHPSDGSRHCRSCTSDRGRASYLANPKPFACLDCEAPVSKPTSRCRSCAGKRRWQAKRAS